MITCITYLWTSWRLIPFILPHTTIKRDGFNGRCHCGHVFAGQRRTSPTVRKQTTRTSTVWVRMTTRSGTRVWTTAEWRCRTSTCSECIRNCDQNRDDCRRMWSCRSHPEKVRIVGVRSGGTVRVYGYVICWPHRHCEMYPYLGLACEWVGHKRVAVLQLCDYTGYCAIIRIIRMNQLGSMPDDLSVSYE